MKTPAELSAHIQDLRSELTGHVDAVAENLLKSNRMDIARMPMLLRSITKLTFDLTHFLPSIGTAHAARVAECGPLSPAEMHVWAELNRRSFEVRGWLNQWSIVEHAILRQIQPKRRELYWNSESADDTVKAQMAVSNAAFDMLHEILNPAPQSEVAREHGCFADITLPNSVFLEHAHAAYRMLLAKRLKRPTRFLDVGCGSGFKVLTASHLFDRAYGLEYDPAYVELAQSMFDRAKSDRCQVFCADGLTHTEYDIYDVIYFYRPMRHQEQLRALEHQIVSNAARGTLIIAPYRMFASRSKELGCAHVAGQLYMAGTSQEDADRLRQEAEMTGTYVSQVAPRGDGIWDPIIAASHTMGFGLSGPF